MDQDSRPQADASLDMMVNDFKDKIVSGDLDRGYSRGEYGDTPAPYTERPSKSNIFILTRSSARQARHARVGVDDQAQ